MDWVLWVVRAILIIVGFIVLIMIQKGKKGLSFRFYSIGVTAFTLGVILLILSYITGPFWFAGLYLATVGSIIFIIGLVIRNTTWENK